MDDAPVVTNVLEMMKIFRSEQEEKSSAINGELADMSLEDGEGESTPDGPTKDKKVCSQVSSNSDRF